MELALLIREVETTLLRFFSEGRVNGTVHTCTGQEYSAIAFAGQAQTNDVVFSNHRCHGHFIAKTGEYQSLIAEVLGKRSGVCGGVGSSQHLHADSFYSNGIQGGIVPLAAGAALCSKLKSSGNVAIAYIGDGTLGEGALYETLNIASKWSLPLLIVCENNRVAQTTTVETGVAGDILARAQAFGIATMEGATWEPGELLAAAHSAIEKVRSGGQPLFFLVHTDRLGPHSKGDDTRDPLEVASYRLRDPLTILLREDPNIAKLARQVARTVSECVARAEADVELSLTEYYQPHEDREGKWVQLESVAGKQVDRINRFFIDAMAVNPNVLFIGEDVLSPYGGAFKTAKQLSALYPGRVFSTPISEAAIVGIGNGLALRGMRPFVELMFGDFTALAFDQILNHAAKFRHMYNHQVRAPIVIRAPMGGKRGYGPTHSQSLDKFLLGIDQIEVVALNTLVDPAHIYADVLDCEGPVFVIENKLDYGRHMQSRLPTWVIAQRSDAPFPVVRVRPDAAGVDVSIVTYGGMVDDVLDALSGLFEEHEILAEVIVPTRLRPLDIESIVRATEATRRLLVVEEGSLPGGFGSEVLASVCERLNGCDVARVGALPVPIPSSRGLESAVLPGKADVTRAVLGLMRAKK